ncbi:helix-turn-helix domain-containing protein [Nonomuraea sp. NPDC049784]|uniref:winged helix-turn-helix transcriptional regulator n=1 Tax=Nonomuraea sp. NPDC049784 TaxID=3154361 RepID=UPI0033FCCEA3
MSRPGASRSAIRRQRLHRHERGGGLADHPVLVPAQQAGPGHRWGPRRFNELRRTVPGISQRMLTATLRVLEHDGLVTRSVYAEVPPRVDYELTPLGRTLLERVWGLIDWAVERHDDIEGARGRYDVRRTPEKSQQNLRK